MSGLQDQRAALALSRKQIEDALNMGIPGQTGETTVRVKDDDLAIVNRSPTTHIVNNHGIPVWAILILVLVLALLAGGAWLLLHPVLPTPAPVSPPATSSGEQWDVKFFDP